MVRWNLLGDRLPRPDRLLRHGLDFGLDRVLGIVRICKLPGPAHLYGAYCGLFAAGVGFFILNDRRTKEARDLATQARLLALRIRQEQAQSQENGVHHDHPWLSSDFERTGPEMVFYLVYGQQEVTEVEIFLDENMLGQLRADEPAAWQGLIEFVEDDVR
jgi:hypothetical protein